MYGVSKVTMGPELVSMKLKENATRSLAIHEAGHCLVGYLLNKSGHYLYKPRIATIIGRYWALGHVSVREDENYDRRRFFRADTLLYRPGNHHYQKIIFR